MLAAPCRNRRETRNPVRVTIPNGKTIESTHERELRIEALPEAARHVHMLPGLANHSLVDSEQDLASCIAKFPYRHERVVSQAR